MSDLLSISQCNLAQTVGESNRFLFHVMLVHFATCIIEGKKAFLGEELFRTLLITAMAITMYHVFFRKIIEPKVEKMKLICYNDRDRIFKKKEISKQYQTDNKQKTKDDSNISRSSIEEEFSSKESRTWKRKKEIKPKFTERRNTPRDYSKRQQVLRYRSN